MSEQQNFTESPVAENVFEQLDQELRRLKSAVSHLSLSESAATQAIEAAERVVVQQGQLSQQLTDYLSRLPQPQTDGTATLMAELSQSAAAQQQSLQQLTVQLAADKTGFNESGTESQYRILAEKAEERQQQLGQTLAEIKMQLDEGISHHISQELDELLQQVAREAAAGNEQGQMLSQVQQVVREMASANNHGKLLDQLKQVGRETAAIGEQGIVLKQLQQKIGEIAFMSGHDNLLKQLQQVGRETAVIGEHSKLLNQLQRTAREIQESQHSVTAYTKDWADSRQIESLTLEELQRALNQRLTEWHSQLQLLLQPLINPKAPQPLASDHEVHIKVGELMVTVAAQQRMLKGQRIVGLVTLLGVLAMLAMTLFRG